MTGTKPRRTSRRLVPVAAAAASRTSATPSRQARSCSRRTTGCAPTSASPSSGGGKCCRYAECGSFDELLHMSQADGPRRKVTHLLRRGEIATSPGSGCPARTQVSGSVLLLLLLLLLLPPAKRLPRDAGSATPPVAEVQQRPVIRHKLSPPAADTHLDVPSHFRCAALARIMCHCSELSQ